MSGSKEITEWLSPFLCPFYGTRYLLFLYHRQQQCIEIKEVTDMKGYIVESGYMGYIDGEYHLFADEQDYREVFGEER